MKTDKIIVFLVLLVWIFSLLFVYEAKRCSIEGYALVYKLAYDEGYLEGYQKGLHNCVVQECELTLYKKPIRESTTITISPSSCKECFKDEKIIA